MDNTMGLDCHAFKNANALAKYGWITGVDRDAGIVKLTNSGERYITGYVEMTGDGPEDLKAMFRF